jgi:c-di-GMP-binding flagellar brake protein YcgR
VEEEPREFIKPEIEKRRHRRARLVAQVRCEPLEREELLLTRDISVGGMFISSRDPLPSPSDVTVSFRLKPGEPLLTCQGRVVYSIKEMGMGIQFEGLAESIRQALQKFVDEAS